MQKSPFQEPEIVIHLIGLLRISKFSGSFEQCSKSGGSHPPLAEYLNARLSNQKQSKSSPSRYLISIMFGLPIRRGSKTSRSMPEPTQICLFVRSISACRNSQNVPPDSSK